MVYSEHCYINVSIEKKSVDIPTSYKTKISIWAEMGEVAMHGTFKKILCISLD